MHAGLGASQRVWFGLRFAWRRLVCGSYIS